MLRFLFSLNEMESMRTERQFRLLKTNIGRIRSLIQVMSFSLADPEAESSFLFSTEDHGKLGSSRKGEPSLTITQITTWAPIAEDQKQMYLMKMMTLSNHLLRDKKIFVLMLMILLFSDESDPEVTSLHKQYWTMLERYIETQTTSLSNYYLGMLQNIVKSLVN